VEGSFLPDKSSQATLSHFIFFCFSVFLFFCARRHLPCRIPDTKTAVKMPLGSRSQQSWQYSRNSPLDSVGSFRGTLSLGILRTLHLWEATGEALSLFNDRIKPEIISFLKEHSEKAHESGSYLSIPLFMIGKRPEKPKPTVMLVSDDKEARKEAFDLVKESGIMAKYPGYEVGHSDFEKLVALAGSPKPIYGRKVDRAAASCLLFSYPRHDTSHGRPIVTATVATGNIVSYQGKPMFLTIDHFLDGSYPASPSMPVDGTIDGSNCEITGLGDFDDGDEGRDYQYNNTFMDATSQGSISTSSDSGESARSSSVGSRNSFRGALHTPSFPSPLPEAGPDLRPLIENCYVVGSTIIRSTSLDYVLVQPSFGVDSAVMREHYLPLDDGSRIEPGPRKTTVVTKTPDGRITKGVMSSSPYHVRLPRHKDFIGVYAARFSRPLDPGDCGCLVTDAETGRIFGHVFAASSVDGLTAIMPATLVFKDAVKLLEELHNTAIKTQTEQYQQGQIDPQSLIQDDMLERFSASSGPSLHGAFSHEAISTSSNSFASVCPERAPVPASKRLSGKDESAWEDFTYGNAHTLADGLYHCPWEGEASCGHEPDKMKCSYE